MVGAMPTERRHPNVINQDEIEPRTTTQGKHAYVTRTFGPHAGNAQLGATLTEVPPGKISYPFHYHCIKEEALYVISGTGTARIGEARVRQRAPDDQRRRRAARLPRDLEHDAR